MLVYVVLTSCSVLYVDTPHLHAVATPLVFCRGPHSLNLRFTGRSVLNRRLAPLEHLPPMETPTLLSPMSECLASRLVGVCLRLLVALPERGHGLEEGKLKEDRSALYGVYCWKCFSRVV